jgi:hypothetical protein
MPRSLKLLKLHKSALGFCTQALGERSPSQPYPSAAEQARRRRGRVGGGKQVRGWAIGLMCGLFAVVARAERGPAMAGGEAVASRPPRLRFRGNAGDARPSSAIGGSHMG